MRRPRLGLPTLLFPGTAYLRGGRASKAAKASPRISTNYINFYGYEWYADAILTSKQKCRGRVPSVKPGWTRQMKTGTTQNMLWPSIDKSKLKPPLSMSHSTKAISSHSCSFVDRARRHKRLDTFRTTVTTVITNQTLKQNPICVSL